MPRGVQGRDLELCPDVQGVMAVHSISLGVIVAFDSAYKAAQQKLICICFMKMQDRSKSMFLEIVML